MSDDDRYRDQYDKVDAACAAERAAEKALRVAEADYKAARKIADAAWDEWRVVEDGILKSAREPR